MFKVSLVDEGSNSSSSVGLTTISILRCDPNSNTFETGFGNNTTTSPSGGGQKITFTDLAGAGGASLQTAYEVDNSIAMSATSGDFEVAPSTGESAGFSLTGSASSGLETTGANNLTIETGSGVLNLQSSTGAVNMTTANSAVVTVRSGTSIASASDTYGYLTLNGDEVSLISQGGTDSTSSTTSSMDLQTGGALDLKSKYGQITLSTEEEDIRLLSDRGVYIESQNLNDDSAEGAIQLYSVGGMTFTSGASGNAAGGTGHTMSFNAYQGSITMATNIASNNSSLLGNIQLYSVGRILLESNVGDGHFQLNDGKLSLTAGKATSSSNTNAGDLTLTSEQNFEIDSAGTTKVKSDGAMTLETTVGDKVITITTLGTDTTFTGGGSEIGVRTDEFDLLSKKTFNIEAQGVGASTTSRNISVMTSTGANSEIQILANQSGSQVKVQSSSDLNLIGGGTSKLQGSTIQLKGTASAGTDLVSVLDTNDSSIATVSSEKTRLKNAVIIGQSATSSSDVMTGSGSPLQVGSGVEVSFEQQISVGHILCVSSNLRFGLGNALRASSSASEIPQNPIGVALTNGQSSSVSTGLMSTVFGAVVFVQLAPTPSASDLGMPVYLSTNIR